MSKSWCSTCGQFMLFPDTHKCPPMWGVQMVGWNDGEWADIYALDAEVAAEKYVERKENDCAEYSIASGCDEAKVLVKGPDGRVTTLIVEGETVPSYRAREVAST